MELKAVSRWYHMLLKMSNFKQKKNMRYAKIQESVTHKQERSKQQKLFVRALDVRSNRFQSSHYK